MKSLILSSNAVSSFVVELALFPVLGDFDFLVGGSGCLSTLESPEDESSDHRPLEEEEDDLSIRLLCALITTSGRERPNSSSEDPDLLADESPLPNFLPLESPLLLIPWCL